MAIEKPGYRPSFVRRKFLIYPKFQLALIGANAVILFMVCTIVGLQSWRSMIRLSELGMRAGLQPGHPYFEFLELQARTFYSYLATGVVAALLLSAAATLLLSHKLAGPLVRLRRYFEDMAVTGKVAQPLSFRKGDYLNELPESINRGIDSVSKNSRAA